MTAVSLHVPNQIGPATLPQAALSQGPTAGGGFIDLISLLLGSAGTEPEPSAVTPSNDTAPFNNVAFSNPDVSINQVALAQLVSPQVVGNKVVPNKGQSSTPGPSTNAAPLGLASAAPDQIASALIRFMTKSAAPGAVVSIPATAPVKKATFNQKSASTVNTTSLPSFLAPVAIAVAPQPAVVTIDSQAVRTTSIPRVGEPKTETAGGFTESRSAIIGPDINRAMSNNSVDPAPAVPSAPNPFFQDLKSVMPASPATAPVAFKMLLTPVASQETFDPQTPSDPHFIPVAQNSAAPEIPPLPGPATATLKPAPSAPDPVSSPASSVVPAAFSLTDLNRPASTGDNGDEADQGPSGVSTKAITDAAAGDPAKRGSEKSGTDTKSGGNTKSGADANTGQDPTEKTPVAPPSVSSIVQIQAAVVPALHNPVAPQSAPTPHAAASSPNAVDQPDVPPATAAKDVFATPVPSPGQTQQIEVRITQPQAPPVDLQVAQRSGQIQVVVRTPDAGLESALRQDLGTLVHSLERSGFQAETFIPTASESSRMNSNSDTQHQHQDSSGNGSFTQSGGQGGQNQGRNGGRGSGGNSRGNASRDPQFEAWTNPYDQRQEQ